MAFTRIALLIVAVARFLCPAMSQDQVEVPEDDGADLPSEDTCYADATATGCPGSLGYDAQMAVCGCGYEDNNWFHVLGKFVKAFRTGSADRSQLAEFFGVRTEAEGLLSMDVGLPKRIHCGEAVLQAYPGTETALNGMQLYRLASNFIYPQVRNELNRLCLPGRMALQLLCLHAELIRKNIRSAKGYAKQLDTVFPMAEPCLQSLTPWPFPGLKEYLVTWRTAPPEDAADPRLQWWPAPALMRAKLPHESEQHYWPCVEMAEPLCFPGGSDNLYTSCAHCCDPQRGPMGNSECFVGEWTFARCCRTPGNSGRFY